MPVHFLDLAAAVEKLRWAEKEWRELDQEMGADPGLTAQSDDEDEDADEDAELMEVVSS